MIKEFISGAVIVSVLCMGGCSKESGVDERFSSPQKTYRLWLKTTEEGDISGNLDCVTESSRALIDTQFRHMDSFIKGMTARAMVMKNYSVMEQRIDEEEAVMVLKGPKGDTFAIPFKKEADGWKVDLAAFLGGG